MTYPTTTDKLTVAFAALRAYGCQNLYELEALLGSDPDSPGYLGWDELADRIIDCLKGQADYLDQQADMLSTNYRAQAAAVRSIIEGGAR